MIEYIKNIIPRIQHYSKGLNKIELLVDPKKPWIHFNESGNYHQYIFMRDKRLIMIFNGVTKTGKWELLHTNQLMIDRISDQITLDHLFVEKALLILKLSGVSAQPFILINSEEIPDLNVLRYLQNFENKKKTISGNFTNAEDENNNELLRNLIFIGIALFILIIILGTLSKN